MEPFKVDVIIFGATGFTGKYIVEECANVGPGQFTWAIAGRNGKKLRELLEKTSAKTGIDVTNIPTIIANCDDEQSLDEMAKQGHVVINCSGPYRFYGEPVVRACIQNSVHYVDVCGEPEFMDKMQLLYNDAAQANGCYVVSSCGMDSVPVDLGVVHFMKNFDGQVNYVESYMRFTNNRDTYEPVCNVTTWESAVHGYSNIKNLIEVRRQLFSKARKLRPQPLIPHRPTIHRSELCDNKYSIAFPGADRSVVVRTQMFLAEQCNLRPVQFNAFMICDSYLILLAMLIVGYFLQTLTKYSLGRTLLLKYPEYFSLGMFSRSGPSEEAISSSTATYKFVGEGWSSSYLKNISEPKTITDPTNVIMTTMVNIKNPTYGFTAMCAVLSAVTLLKEPENLPPRGGVYTPGGAFYDTKFLENMESRGVKFEVIETRQK